MGSAVTLYKPPVANLMSIIHSNPFTTFSLIKKSQFIPAEVNALKEMLCMVACTNVILFLGNTWTIAQ